MKKNYFSFAILALAFAAWSCNDNSSGTSSTDSPSNMNSADTMNNMNNTNANNTNMNMTPFSKDDSMFVMETAMGGMMEVQAGQAAQQMGMSQRVKDFGAMLVRDHTQANNELMSIASSHGLMLPKELPADKQKMMDNMNKMSGKSFDKDFISMMVADHQKDISKFKRQSSSGTADDLKAFAGKTLPVLQIHMDTVNALKKIKM